MEAATLTDRLMSEMVSTNAVIMVERNQMNEILEEQGLQQAGCTSAECAAEVGALLGVQNMVSGSVGKLGNTYTVDAKMILKPYSGHLAMHPLQPHILQKYSPLAVIPVLPISRSFGYVQP
jgi:hypothetical protein